MTFEGVFSIGLALLVLYCWGDNLWRCVMMLSRYRDARAIRATMVAFLLFMASVFFVIRAVAVYIVPDPFLLDVARATVVIVIGSYIVGGIVTRIGWEQDT